MLYNTAGQFYSLHVNQTINTLSTFHNTILYLFISKVKTSYRADEISHTVLTQCLLKIFSYLSRSKRPYINNVWVSIRGGRLSHSMALSFLSSFSHTKISYPPFTLIYIPTYTHTVFNLIIAPLYFSLLSSNPAQFWQIG